MIRFSCPGCDATYTVGDEKAGKTGKCPKCQSQFVIPMAEPGASAPPPLPEAPKSGKSPEPPAPAPVEPGTVEISPCPSCSTRLTVETTDLGSDVQCPTCNTVFKATRPGSTPPVPPPAPPKLSKLEDAGRREKASDDEDEKPKKKSRWGDDDEERPSKKKRRDDDEEEDDDRPRKKSRRDDDEEEDDRPRKKSRRDDDDDDDDRPRKKKRSRSGRLEPHRGMLILILGILGLVCCGICAIVAVILGGSDLKKMDDGIMDDEGRTLTNIGRIIGIVAIVLNLFAICGNIVLTVLAGR
jgi:predicted Zn finger-like uncharacterized protein